MKTQNELLARFGDNVRRLRQANGLSQEKLAERAQLDRTYIGGIERGERNLSLLNIIKLAKSLDVTPAQLFEGF